MRCHSVYFFCFCLRALIEKDCRTAKRASGKASELSLCVNKVLFSDSQHRCRKYYFECKRSVWKLDLNIKITSGAVEYKSTPSFKWDIIQQGFHVWKVLTAEPIIRIKNFYVQNSFERCVSTITIWVVKCERNDLCTAVCGCEEKRFLHLNLFSSTAPDKRFNRNLRFVSNFLWHIKK